MRINNIGKKRITNNNNENNTKIINNENNLNNANNFHNEIHYEEHNIINIDNLSYEYEKEYPIIKNISFSVRENESIGLIGANGVGKSTILKIMVGLLSGYKGEVNIKGMEVNKNNLYTIRKKVGYVFQDSECQLFSSTVYEDVAFAPRNYGYTNKEVDMLVNKALNYVNIDYLRDKQIYKMSGGEKKMAAIATILAIEPDIILMDEPSIALDPRNRRNLINLLNSFTQLKIIASHDLDMILDTCNRTILLSKGEIVKDGNTLDILSDRKLLEENGLELPLSIMGRD